MMKAFTLRRAASALAAAALVAGASAARAELNVVTTTADLAAITRTIGGNAVKADSLTSGASDAHFAVPKPSMIRRVRDADLLIAIGAELEIGWLPPVLTSAANPRINQGQPGHLDLSGFVALLQESGPVSRAQGDVHKSGNPHYMLDPRNGIVVARAIAARLTQLDPAHTGTYRRNLADFETAFPSKWAQWQAGFAPLRGKSVVTYHKSMSYLARAFGFYVVGEVEPLPGISPTISHLERLAETIKHNNVRLLLMESFYERRSAEFLGGKTGIKIAVIPHSVEFEAGMKSYFDLFDAILKAIRATGAY
jgi:zinc/manganese transport system substrate-binding protein